MGMRHPDELVRRRLMSRGRRSLERGWGGVGCLEFTGRARGGLRLEYGRLWDGERVQYVHRLAWEVFVGAIPGGLDVLHRCDNGLCFEPGHLWCGTHAENMADQYAKGRHLAGRIVAAEKRRGQPAPWARGSRHARAKLTEDQVREIRKRLKWWGIDRRCHPAELALEYGVSDSLIRGIGRGANWGWLS